MWKAIFGKVKCDLNADLASEVPVPLPLYCFLDSFHVSKCDIFWVRTAASEFGKMLDREKQFSIKIYQ